MLGSIDCLIEGVGLFVGTALDSNENEGSIVEPSVGNTEGTGEAYNKVGELEGSNEGVQLDINVGRNEGRHEGINDGTAIGL